MMTCCWYRRKAGKKLKRCSTAFHLTSLVRLVVVVTRQDLLLAAAATAAAFANHQANKPRALSLLGRQENNRPLEDIACVAATAAYGALFSSKTAASEEIEEKADSTSLSPSSSLLPLSFVRWRRRPAPCDDAGTEISGGSSSCSSSSFWELQTSVMTYRRRQQDILKSTSNDGGTTAPPRETTTIDLHSVIHLGEPSYYESINSDLLRDKNGEVSSPTRFASHSSLSSSYYYDAVVYELLVDQSLLRPIDIVKSRGDARTAQSFMDGKEDGIALRELVEPVEASRSDRILARSYGLACQSDCVRYFESPGFIHGDWTRQELIRHQENKVQQQDRERNHPGTYRNRTITPGGWASSPLLSLLSHLQRQLQQQPAESQALWRRQGGGWSAAREAATALWAGPPLLLAQQLQQQKSLRGLTIVPSFQRFLRSIVWLTVPSPEVSVLLLDWSALLKRGASFERYDEGDRYSSGAGKARRRRSNAAIETVFPSPASRSVLAALASGDWNAARTLVFGQILFVAASSTTTATRDPDDWMSLRNDRAIRVVNRVIEEKQRQKQESTSVAILYGCLHCPDLHERIVDMGYEPLRREWRTAWTVRVPDFSAAATTARLLDRSVLQLLVLLVLYLGLGGIDWIATVGDVTRAASDMVRAASVELPPYDSVDEPVSVMAPLSVVQDYVLYLARHLLLYLGLSKFVWSTKERIDEATYTDQSTKQTID